MRLFTVQKNYRKNFDKKFFEENPNLIPEMASCPPLPAHEAILFLYVTRNDTKNREHVLHNRSL